MNTENNYDQNEATKLDGENVEMENVVAENVEDITAPVDEENSWKKVAIGAGSGILLGSVAVLLSSSTTKEVGEEVSEDVKEQLNQIVDDKVALATLAKDDMSFSEAFAVAREEVGSGGAFEWRGNVYSTFTAQEWDHMSAQEHAEYGSHFNWAARESAPTHHVAQQHTTPANDAHVVAQETTHNAENVHTVAETSVNEAEVVVPQADVAVVDAHEPEVEVLGVIHDNVTGINVGGVIVDGQEVVLLDVDADQKFDYVASDLNHDGELQLGEVADISDKNWTVDDLGGFSNPSEDMYADSEAESLPEGLYEV